MADASRLFLDIQPSSGVPIYQQIVNQIEAEVIGGRLRPGQALPSVRDVARALVINPMTVSRAYSLLEARGTLERVRGQTMRVATAAGPGTVRTRLAALDPLLAQIVDRSRRLGLASPQVLAQLERMLKG